MPESSCSCGCTSVTLATVTSSCSRTPPSRPSSRPCVGCAAISCAQKAATTARIGATLVWRPTKQARDERVVIATAGTADLPVADECATVLQAHGFRPTRVSDVGVAGVHRLFPHVSSLQDADVVVVVAGMEGALASVVGGLTAAPVVAVPTSVGYGSSFEGVTALLAMLSSCASGVTVVGIDNGFGAACAVARLTRAGRRYRDRDRDPG